MSFFQNELRSLHGGEVIRVTGRIRRVVGLVAEAEGIPLPVGSPCRIRCRLDGRREVDAEVLGFRDSRTLLMPCGGLEGISPGDPVTFEGGQVGVKVSPSLLGRVLDGRGEPIDDKGPVVWDEMIPLNARSVRPLERQRISEPFGTGVRAIDALLTVGRGQRLGIFSGSGVGKSMLLGMLARFSEAPISVVALIGERGREVREFVERDLGEEGMKRSVLVVSTSDDPPVLRMRAARLATAIAEWFRDRGQDVVFLLDSITRVALAQRELGLSASEPPTTKAFPPSVFSMLPQLLERTGPGERASITSFYTVLVEGDDLNDPIADTVRGILDGHVWLSRKLANRSHFPAIDVLESVSRVMKDVVGEEHRLRAQRLVEDLARYRDVEDLIQLGAYVRGSDARTDGAVERMPRIEQLLRQPATEHARYVDAITALDALYPEVS